MTSLSPIWRSRFAIERVTFSPSQKGHDRRIARYFLLFEFCFFWIRRYRNCVFFLQRWKVKRITGNPMTDPWDWYIYLHELLVVVGKYKVQVKYTVRPMDPTWGWALF